MECPEILSIWKSRKETTMVCDATMTREYVMEKHNGDVYQAGIQYAEDNYANGHYHAGDVIHFGIEHDNHCARFILFSVLVSDPL